MDEFTEQDIYDGMGLEMPEQEPPAAAGATSEPEGEPGTPEATEPSAAEAGTGEPAAQENPALEDNNPIGEQGGNPGGTGPRPEGAAVTPAFSAENARAEEVRAAQAAATQAELDAAYAEAFRGKINPYTGAPILSKADYDAYKESYNQELQQAQQVQQQRQVEQMKAAGIDPAAINAIIEQHPAVRQAQEVLEETRRARAQAVAAQARGWYAEQVREISAMDPEIKSLEDLQTKHPEQYPQLMQAVSAGVPLAAAYKGLNFDTLAARRAAAAQQAAVNKVTGKAHLAPVGGQTGKGGPEIPAATMQTYREMFPDMTDAEIQKEFAQYAKEAGL